MSTLKVHGRKVNHKDCPVIEASTIVGDFWNLWIIRTLMEGPKRFSHIQSAIPTINKVTLNNKLKTLIKVKVVVKSFNKDLKSQYSLTTKGKNLDNLLIELETYAKKNF